MVKVLSVNGKIPLVDGKAISATGGGGGSTVELDTTLSEAGKAADAKAVGDALAGKQDTISDLEAIRSGAAKGATALQSVPSTYRTASAQDVIDAKKQDTLIQSGATVGQIAKITAVDDTGKPTAWEAVDMPSGGAVKKIVVAQTELVSGIIPSGEVGWAGHDLGITLADIQKWEEIFVEFYGMTTSSFWGFRPRGRNIPDAFWISGSSRQCYLLEWVDSEHTYIRVKSFINGLGGGINGIVNAGEPNVKAYTVVCIADWSNADPTAQMMLFHNVATDADLTYKVWGITKKEA